MMTSYVYPGCGYGGYCLPKDTNALYAVSKSAGYDAQILKNVILTNDNMPDVILRRIVSELRDKMSVIGILGLSFKPLSDDVRDTPAAKIINKLFENGYTEIYAYDPVAINEFNKYYPEYKIKYCGTIDELISKVDVLVITTAWDEFKKVPAMTDKTIIDCRFML